MTLIILRDAEVQADGFRMANVQITVRLRREAGVNGGVLTGSQIFINDLTDKVSREGFCLTHHGFIKA